MTCRPTVWTIYAVPAPNEALALGPIQNPVTLISGSADPLMTVTKNPEAAEVSLTEAQTVALPLLAAGAKKKDAAAAAGVCPQTVSDWLKAPHFAAAIKAKREELTELASARLAEATNEAVGAVIDLMKSTCESTRFKAATYVLDRVLLLDARVDQNHQNAASKTADLLISLGVNLQ